MRFKITAEALLLPILPPMGPFAEILCFLDVVHDSIRRFRITLSDWIVENPANRAHKE